MQKIIDYIASKAVSDNSMATVMRMIRENVGRTEDCLLLAFESLYETNLNLAKALVLAEKTNRKKVVSTPTSIITSSNSGKSR